MYLINKNTWKKEAIVLGNKLAQLEVAINVGPIKLTQVFYRSCYHLWTDKK